MIATLRMADAVFSVVCGMGAGVGWVARSASDRLRSGFVRVPGMTRTLTPDRLRPRTDADNDRSPGAKMTGRAVAPDALQHYLTIPPPARAAHPAPPTGRMPACSPLAGGRRPT